MSSSRRLSKHRATLAQRGLKRIEFRATPEDAKILRSVAAMLTDPERARSLRGFLELQEAAETRSLIDYLRASPLPEIDLDIERDRSPMRDIEF
ncbi:MAG: hypothetical protein K2X11_10950 [Acetobacteraceae bacterium]|nr:hypothetical protein [Acetobacteraceae bacterium]